MIESLAPVLVPVIVVAFAVAAVAFGWRLLRAFALAGARENCSECLRLDAWCPSCLREPLELAGYASPPPSRRPSVDWSELVLVSLVLLQLGLLASSDGSAFALANVLGLLIAGAMLRSRLAGQALEARLGGPHG